MAESPCHTASPEPAQATASSSDAATAQYWCYHCEKSVSIETLPSLPDVICRECKNGFVECISAIQHSQSSLPSLTPDHAEDPSFGSQFLQVLRLIALAARDEDAPQHQASGAETEDDFLRIELDGWVNDDDGDGDDDGNENEENEENNRNDDDGDGEEENGGGDETEEGEDRSDNDDEENADSDYLYAPSRRRHDLLRLRLPEFTTGDETEEGEDRSDNDDEENADSEYVDDPRRRRHDLLRLRLREFATRAGTRSNRILDWAEILMGLEGNSIELRLDLPESDRYVGNPEDYVDAAGYEALLQNLAENDGGRRGAPPAAEAAVLELPTVEISSDQETIVCAICKDAINVGEAAKKIPCGHGYHGECILPWLASRNTCPVCRFELPTDDHEYEEERKKRVTLPPTVGGASGSSGSG